MKILKLMGTDTDCFSLYQFINSEHEFTIYIEDDITEELIIKILNTIEVYKHGEANWDYDTCHHLTVEILKEEKIKFFELESKDITVINLG